MTTMKSGVVLIAEERRRQVEKEGYSPEHDDQHTLEEIALAAACYATPLRARHRRHHYGSGRAVNDDGSDFISSSWPWEKEAWKPTTRVRELIKAGALIAAEIDRLQRDNPQAMSPTAVVPPGNTEAVAESDATAAEAA